MEEDIVGMDCDWSTDDLLACPDLPKRDTLWPGVKKNWELVVEEVVVTKVLDGKTPFVPPLISFYILC